MLDSDKPTAPRGAETSGDELAFAPIHVLAERLRTGSAERERAARSLSAAHPQA